MINANFLYENDDYAEKKVDSKRVVCELCNGNGTHVNHNIDGNGITGEEMDHLGPEFSENYLSGHYDVTCTECKGNKVLDIVDVDSLSDEDKKAYLAYVDEVRQAELERYYEIKAGC